MNLTSRLSTLRGVLLCAIALLLWHGGTANAQEADPNEPVGACTEVEAHYSSKEPPQPLRMYFTDAAIPPDALFEPDDIAQCNWYDTCLLVAGFQSDSRCRTQPPCASEEFVRRRARTCNQNVLLLRLTVVPAGPATPADPNANPGTGPITPAGVGGPTPNPTFMIDPESAEWVDVIVPRMSESLLPQFAPVTPPQPENSTPVNPLFPLLPEAKFYAPSVTFSNSPLLEYPLLENWRNFFFQNVNVQEIEADSLDTSAP